MIKSDHILAVEDSVYYTKNFATSSAQKIFLKI